MSCRLYCSTAQGSGKRACLSVPLQRTRIKTPPGHTSTALFRDTFIDLQETHISSCVYIFRAVLASSPLLEITRKPDHPLRYRYCSVDASLVKISQ